MSNVRPDPEATIIEGDARMQMATHHQVKELVDIAHAWEDKAADKSWLDRF